MSIQGRTSFVKTLTFQNQKDTFSADFCKSFTVMPIFKDTYILTVNTSWLGISVILVTFKVADASKLKASKVIQL